MRAFPTLVLLTITALSTACATPNLVLDVPPPSVPLVAGEVVDDSTAPQAEVVVVRYGQAGGWASTYSVAVNGRPAGSLGNDHYVRVQVPANGEQVTVRVGAFSDTTDATFPVEPGQRHFLQVTPVMGWWGWDPSVHVPDSAERVESSLARLGEKTQ